MPKKFIYQCNPKASYIDSKDQIDQAIKEVLNSGFYILGEQVKAFEKEFSEFLDVRYSIGVASGTDALQLALKAIGVKNGDLIITVSHTAVATVTSIELSGAVPVLVDIEPDSYTIDVKKLEKVVIELKAKGLKAIIPVHIYGHPADMDAVKKIAERHGLWIVEDCAQAHGSEYKGNKVGTIGHIGAFSFYPTKNLGAFGDGGSVITNDPELADRVKRLREYGWKERYISHESGMNTRLDEIQAAILRVKLKNLDRENEKRRSIANRYGILVKNELYNIPVEKSYAKHVYHQYVIRSSRRDELRDYLGKKGIGTGIHYPVPVHLQPAYKERIILAERELPVTEQICTEILSLPIYPQLSDEQIKRVVEALNCFK